MLHLVHRLSQHLENGLSSSLLALPIRPSHRQSDHPAPVSEIVGTATRSRLVQGRTIRRRDSTTRKRQLQRPALRRIPTSTATLTSAMVKLLLLRPISRTINTSHSGALKILLHHKSQSPRTSTNNNQASALTTRLPSKKPKNPSNSAHMCLIHVQMRALTLASMTAHLSPTASDLTQLAAVAPVYTKTTS